MNARSAALLIALSCGAVWSSGGAQRVPYGTLWTLYRVGAAGEGRTVTAGVLPTLQFGAGRVTGWDGCNGYVAGYVADESALKIGTPSAGAQGCGDPNAKALEHYFLRSLPKVKRFRVTDDFLVLFTEDFQTLVFRRGDLP